jgi:hypothetical protein
VGSPSHEDKLAYTLQSRSSNFLPQNFYHPEHAGNFMMNMVAPKTG